MLSDKKDKIAAWTVALETYSRLLPEAGFLILKRKEFVKMKKVAVIMGSDSDFPVVEKGVAVLKELDIPFECRVISAHRTPAAAAEFASKARENGFGVIIAAAGMAAHLAGAFAANCILPVIGIPVKSTFDGMDALLSTVQMPSGIPVATVGVNNAKNAALLAAEILAAENDELYKKLGEERERMKKEVEEKDKTMMNKFQMT